MKQLFLLSLVCLATIAELSVARHSHSHDWLNYKRKHGKVYEQPEEDTRRFSLFMAAKESIMKHNAQQNVSYHLGLNHLSDWSNEELAKLNGFRYDAKKHHELLKASMDDEFLRSILNDTTPVPHEFDWRKVPGRVGPVKDQYQCGSCWAFATTGLLEGQQLPRNLTSQLVPLSEQELVDCSKNDFGCDGGIMSEALSDIANLGGIESEKDYPYLGEKTKCKFSPSKIVMTDLGAVSIPSHSKVIKKVLARYGPISTTMAANKKLAQYKMGIFNDPECETEPNHAVLLVGYGTDPDEGDYWIVKNSWSDEWGENGFFKIKQGTCAVGVMSTIAKFKK